MKTPREILLQNHRAAQRQLDAVREEALAGLSDRLTGANDRGFWALLREVLALPRPAWAALAAAWVIIVGLNLAADDRSSPSPVTMADRSPAMRQALAEQRRFYVELVRSPMPADVPSPVLKPRSERRPTIVAV